MDYELGLDTQQGVLLVNLEGILTQNGLVRHYLEVTDLLERYRVQCSIVNLLNVTSCPVSTKAITSLSRTEPLCISAKPRVFVANGRASIDLWRSFISTNRNPTRTRLAVSVSEALELLDVRPLVLDVKRDSRTRQLDFGLLANQCALRLSQAAEL